jgi:ABC-type multidrug transport system ATPase subunit
MQNFEVFARYFDIDKKTARERALSLLKYFALEQRQNARATELFRRNGAPACHRPRPD